MKFVLALLCLVSFTLALRMMNPVAVWKQRLQKLEAEGASQACISCVRTCENPKSNIRCFVPCTISCRKQAAEEQSEQVNEQCICTREYRPVCTASGKRYSNKCGAKCANETEQLYPCHGSKLHTKPGLKFVSPQEVKF